MKKFLLYIALILALPGQSVAEWEIVNNMPNPRHGLSAVTLGNRIYLIGGQEMPGNMGQGLTTVTAFEPQTNSWDESPADLNHGRTYGFATVYDSAIYIFGGRNQQNYISSVEKYNPETNSWSVISEMPVPREGLSGAILGDSLFLSGGSNTDSLYGTTRVGIFRLSDETWHEGPPMLHARSAGFTAVLQNHLFTMGGYRFDPMGFMESFHHGGWEPLDDMPARIANFAGVTTGDSIIIAGGLGFRGYTNQSFIFNQDQWESGPALVYPRMGLSMAVSNGHIYAFGGKYHHSAVSQVEQWQITSVGTVPEESGIPQSFTVQNYPNPFNATTRIDIEIPELAHQGFIYVDIYSIDGRIVLKIQKPYSGPGQYSVPVPASHFQASAGGVYLYRVRAGTHTITGKMTYLP